MYPAKCFGKRRENKKWDVEGRVSREKSMSWENASWGSLQEAWSLTSQHNLVAVHGQPIPMAECYKHFAKTTLQWTVLWLSPQKSTLGTWNPTLEGAPKFLKCFWTTEKADACHLQGLRGKKGQETNEKKVMLLLRRWPGALRGGCAQWFTVIPVNPRQQRASKRNISLKIK